MTTSSSPTQAEREKGQWDHKKLLADLTMLAEQMDRKGFDGAIPRRAIVAIEALASVRLEAEEAMREEAAKVAETAMGRVCCGDYQTANHPEDPPECCAQPIEGPLPLDEIAALIRALPPHPDKDVKI